VSRWSKLIKTLLPKTGDIATDDAARALLRKDPDKYQQYLEALENEFGPQAERAKQLGLNKDVFHGTPFDGEINKFDPSTQGYYGSGVYTADRPELAKKYGENIHKLKIDENMVDVRGPTKEQFNMLTPEEQARFMNAPTQQEGLDVFTRSGKFSGLTAPYKGYNVTSDLSKIRSTNAAFDPRFKESSDILAGTAGATALGAAATASEDSEAAPKFSNLKKALDSKLIKQFAEPYIVKKTDNGLTLVSDVADASASFRDLDTIQHLDPEMLKYLEEIGSNNPVYIEHLEAQKGYGAKALKALEASAKKKGADGAYLNASPLGGTRGLSRSEAADKLKDFYEKNGYNIAEDYGDNAMMYKKLAATLGLGAAAGAGQDSEAAGLATIAKKLGISLDDALKLKQQAEKIAPTGLRDENMRAIQKVTDFKKNPKERFDYGMDQQIYDAGDQVLKVPFKRRFQELEPSPESVMVPGAVHSKGLGPKTKIIETTDNTYTLQDKVMPFDKILKEHPLFTGDETLKKMRAEISELAKGYKTLPTDEAKHALGQQENAMWDKFHARERELLEQLGVKTDDLKKSYEAENYPNKLLYKDNGIKSSDDITEEPLEALTTSTLLDSRRKLFPAMKPRDVHSGNLGFDAQNKPQIFDTSRFSDIDPKAFTPEMREGAIRSYIGSPENKKQFMSKFNKTDVAGIAAMLGAIGGMPEDAEAAGVPKVKETARAYAKLKNILGVTDDVAPTPVKTERAKKIAQAYEDMKHDPTNPDVQKAYKALIDETAEQYKHIKQSGLKTTKITPDMKNPYANSEAMLQDIEQNNHMYYYPTEQGFGSGAAGVPDHPLLQSVEIDGEQVPANDLFRIVHDYYGHAKEGYKFGAKGEEAAWRQHKQMYSPEAQKALTTETRGQNSWVNYGPHGEANRANPANTKYAEQKAGLLPEWAYDTKALAASTGLGAATMMPEKSEASPTLTNPAQFYIDNYNKYIDEPRKKLGEKIMSITSPLSGEDKKRFIDETKPAMDLATDPLNFVEGPAGFAFPIIKELLTKEKPAPEPLDEEEDLRLR
jgi:hypothetical protein